VRVSACLVIVALGVAGCSSKDAPERPRTAPEPEPAGVAYALDRSRLRELKYDYGLIVTDGREVASGPWDPYMGVVLAEYLEEKHRIKLLDGPADLDREVERIARAQEASLMLLSDWHRRRYAQRLADVNPPEDELEDFYVEFSEEQEPEIGRGMVDWLRIFRASLAHARGKTVVAIPLDD
jgi:hypothetical protein